MISSKFLKKRYDDDFFNVWSIIKWLYRPLNTKLNKSRLLRLWIGSSSLHTASCSCMVFGLNKKMTLALFLIWVGSWRYDWTNMMHVKFL